MNNTNKKGLKNHKIDTKILVSIVLTLVVLLMLSTFFMFLQSNKSLNHLENEHIYSAYSVDLVDASDYLTYRVHNYVVSGDRRFYDEYMYEVEVSKKREKAVDGLLELGISDEEKKHMLETFEYSKKLAEIEMEAFELVNQGDLYGAQQLVFNGEYTEYKNKINENYILIKDCMDLRIASENNKILGVTKIAFFVSAIVGAGTMLATILLLFTLYRFKHEADIDQLTGLYNRNRYKERIAEVIEEYPDKFGALIFCDIDNLKFINDCYGHGNGDRYIQATGNILKEFAEFPSVLARPSGDEFIVYIHGFDSEVQMKEVIAEKMKKLRNSYFITTLHIEEKIRFSTGISIYPTDTENVEDLIKFSDYAMYKMKKNSKGEISYYDKTTIDKTIFLARNKGYLDEFLEKELVDFAMQPIVDANTFEIYGYEALMRPQIDIVSSPFLLLELAKVESKLDKIEKLVLKKTFEKINDNIDKLGGCKVFINSIADQVLTEEEFNGYLKKYPDVLKNVVIEVTEHEYILESILRSKTEKFKGFGALVALDDYGSGYSNDYSLLSGIYDIVKVDMNIIRNIDTDIKRQEIVKSIIKVSAINQYSVVAEGVETKSEVLMLQSLGVHYMQGYFFGKPDIEISDISQQSKDLLEEIKNNII